MTERKWDEMGCIGIKELSVSRRRDTIQSAPFEIRVAILSTTCKDFPKVNIAVEIFLVQFQEGISFDKEEELKQYRCSRYFQLL